MPKTVLVIDDDKKLNQLLEDYLGQFKFKVVAVTHPQAGLARLERVKPVIVILDVMLPGMDGFEVCKRIRQISTVPIIMLTARGDVTDRVVGLELGADDYLSKPFEPRELVARIQSILRRGGSTASRANESITCGKLSLHPAQQTAWLGKKPLELTTTEFSILELFMQNVGKVLSREQLLEHLRGLEWESINRSVDVLVSRLRQKMGDDPKRPMFIKTIWGIGYMLASEEE